MSNKKIMRISMLLIGVYFGAGSSSFASSYNNYDNRFDGEDKSYQSGDIAADVAPVYSGESAETESFDDVDHDVRSKAVKVPKTRNPASTLRNSNVVKSCIQMFQENHYTAKVSANGFYIADVKTTSKIGQLSVVKTQYVACNPATNQVFIFYIKAKRDACSSSKTLADQRKYCLTDQSVATPGAVVKPERQQLRELPRDAMKNF